MVPRLAQRCDCDVLVGLAELLKVQQVLHGEPFPKEQSSNGSSRATREPWWCATNDAIAGAEQEAELEEERAKRRRRGERRRGGSWNLEAGSPTRVSGDLPLQPIAGRFVAGDMRGVWIPSSGGSKLPEGGGGRIWDLKY